MADLDMLARWLIACQKRPDPDGRITVSLADAIVLRRMGFWNIEPGRWTVPALPPELIWRYPALEAFGPAARPVASGDVRIQTATPPLTPNPAPPIVQPPVTSRYSGTPLPVSERLMTALSNRIRCRILASLAAHATGCSKRQLQQRLHRIPARDLNQALTRLQTAGLVARNGTSLALAPDARELLVQAGSAVSRTRSARAQRRASDRSTPDNAPQPTRSPDAPVHAFRGKASRPYRRRPIPDRRRFPRQWGRSMSARRGGLAVQKLYRKFGVHPTKPATAARQTKRAQQDRQRAALAAPATVAPVTAMVPTPTGPSYSGTAAAISAALRYSEPMGRRSRLAAERNRR